MHLEKERAVICFERAGVKVINLKFALEHGQILAL